MENVTIRPAHEDEHEEIARVWLQSWASVDLKPVTEQALADAHVRIRHELANGWSLYVADDKGRIAAMLAFRKHDGYLDQLFVAPEYHGQGLGKMLLDFTRQNLPDEIWLRCASMNEKAWRWYEREDFLFEKEEMHEWSGLPMRYYRWKRKGATS
jgi:ribosomal protein S18 acetylase RimI-like enzyme